MKNLTAAALFATTALAALPAAAETVGFAQIGSESGWRAANTKSIQDTLTKENGFDLKFSDAQQKQENQIKAIRGFIAQGVDAILVAPVVATGWDQVLQEAKEAEIPVVLLDRQVDSSEDLYLTAVGSDLEHEGRVAGEWLVQQVGDKTCNVVELQGTTGSSPAIKRKAGFEAGKDVALALDVAASEFHDKGKYTFEGKKKTAQDMAAYYGELVDAYPLVSIEDPLDEDDWDGWKLLTDRIGSKVQLVGDDLFVTNPERLEEGIALHGQAHVVVQHQQVGQPQGQAVDQQAALRRGLLAQYPRQLQRFLHQRPVHRAPLPMMGDARAHLPI